MKIIFVSYGRKTIFEAEKVDCKLDENFWLTDKNASRFC